MRLLPALIQFVKLTSVKHNIDESHSLGHSLNVLNHAHDIFTNSLEKYPFIREQEPIIYASSILHDMCDKKYIDVEEGIRDIHTFFHDRMSTDDLMVVKNIITTMSYSHVKQNGYPQLGRYQMAYHIVREADLLSAYDMNRAIIYVLNSNLTVEASIQDSYTLFENRVLKYIENGLFITDYSKKRSAELHEEALRQIDRWRKIQQCFQKYSEVDNQSL